MNAGKTGLSVSGGGMRCVRALYREGITLENVRFCENGDVKFTVKASDKAKTFAILKNLCYNYSVKWDFVTFSLLKKAALRCGILLSAALCLIAMLLLERVVFFVRVEGVGETDVAAVENAVRSRIMLPCFSESVETAALEREVIALDCVGTCSIAVRGNSLIVKATQAVLPDQPPKKDAIVSEFDAVVTRIVVRKGSALKKTGDAVRAGETLISGEVYSSDGQSVIMRVAPEGEAYGVTSYSLSAVLPETAIEKKYTGRTESRSALLFRGQTPVFRCSFMAYEQSAHSVRTGIFLPLDYVRAEYREVEYVPKKNSVLEQEQALYDALRQSVFGKETDRRTVVTELGGGIFKITVFLAAEVRLTA